VAQKNLGLMLARGDGVARDPVQSVHWLRRAADAGNAEARTLLGAMYWSGEGVPRDHREAARLYLLAAEQGYARAQNNIGFMYGFGEGIPPRDDVQAYKWISLAIRNYTSRNQDRLDQAINDQATLKARMTPAQIADAERLVRDFTPRP